MCDFKQDTQNNREPYQTDKTWTKLNLISNSSFFFFAKSNNNIYEKTETNYLSTIASLPEAQ